MFTINIYLRFALIAIFLIGGIVATPFLGFVWSWIPILIGLILLLGYIFLGTIQSAAQLMQGGNLLETEKRLNLTLKPNWLYSTNRAYYYLMKGTVAQGLGNTDEAEGYLKIAESIELSTDNEKAAVQLQMAGIAAQKERWNQVKLYLKNIKKLKITEQNLKDQVKQFERAVKDRGQLKAARRMGMMPKGGMPTKAGGKRRRPKIR
jgi:energy-coupling factor transporter transmembrane protein EcfT